ncbi:DUF6781 family protein [Halarcobacter anaerophilus]|uniref:DUF6781 family protein n=1 Tax=Halarcobacter anaerophilus TaxID=877500 RepID=UPI0005C90C20|nr:DUF6781 family protein [Halarcobacter anaerophilus]
MELLKIKYKLQEQKESFVAELKDAFDGAKEAASNFSEETKDEIEDSVTHVKLKSIEILGLLEETLKHSVKAIIDEGKDIEAKVAHLTKEATENALKTGQLSTQKIKEVTQAVVVAAAEAAQEAEKSVKETTKGAVEGAKEGILNSIEEAKTKLSKSKDDAEDFVEENVKYAIENFEAIEDAFIEALSNAINKVEDSAKRVIKDTIVDLKKHTSQLKKQLQMQRRRLLII